MSLDETSYMLVHPQCAACCMAGCLLSAECLWRDARGRPGLPCVAMVHLLHSFPHAVPVEAELLMQNGLQLVHESDCSSTTLVHAHSSSDTMLC